ncbi:PREDICTED: protein PLANT CADMIUM RESISTANCE 10-like isoform X2 [Camelina sativa]|uniref:Protein PLANT CADMIUM RESISTANCE 10-like isoform X2 n=1 Tax=Camelina sativa TaxID=90675 RepID=A0ABM0YU09_CAMSA|nr:PREDICTED: protein PLANT CADMIUM RESISTANCE 10-like isoform X2 [Camelina sativa]
MKETGHYVPPPYVPLRQSDSEADSEAEVKTVTPNLEIAVSQSSKDDDPRQWSSGICACFDDMQSCCIGLFCPCYIFGKNAEFLGSGTFAGPCLTHCISWALVNTICCFATNGVLLGLPGCFVSCYACGYRRSLRTKYNLQAPCGDFVTHFFCHLCAICQEYREIQERRSGSYPPGMKMAITDAPLAQTMNSAN